MIWSFKPIFGVCSAMIFHSDTCGHILKCHLVVVTLDLKVVFLFVLSLSLGRECSMKLKWRNVAWTKRRKIRIWSKFKNPDFPKVWKITKYDHCARSKLISIRKKSPIMRTKFSSKIQIVESFNRPNCWAPVISYFNQSKFTVYALHALQSHLLCARGIVLHLCFRSHVNCIWLGTVVLFVVDPGELSSPILRFDVCV